VYVPCQCARYQHAAGDLCFFAPRGQENQTSSAPEQRGAPAPPTSPRRARVAYIGPVSTRARHDARASHPESSFPPSLPYNTMSSDGLHEFEVLGTKFKVDRKYQPLKALGKGEALRARPAALRGAPRAACCLPAQDGSDTELRSLTCANCARPVLVPFLDPLRSLRCGVRGQEPRDGRQGRHQEDHADVRFGRRW
jgi:hypothetical protein